MQKYQQYEWAFMQCEFKNLWICSAASIAKYLKLTRNGYNTVYSAMKLSVEMESIFHLNDWQSCCWVVGQRLYHQQRRQEIPPVDVWEHLHDEMLAVLLLGRKVGQSLNPQVGVLVAMVTRRNHHKIGIIEIKIHDCDLCYSKHSTLHSYLLSLTWVRYWSVAN